MTGRRTILLGAALTLALIALAAFAACSGNNEGSETPTAGGTPTVGETPTAGETPAGTSGPTATPEPTFQGGREPVEGSLGIREGTPPPIGTLVDVRVAEHEGYDRIVFEFDGPPPDYRVEYVENPTQCGSGEPVDIQGSAALAVSFQPTDAHTEAGLPTLGFQSISPGLRSIIEAVQTCDFEAHVTWVVGLAAQADFRVTELEAPLRLAVDIAHP